MSIAVRSVAVTGIEFTETRATSVSTSSEPVELALDPEEWVDAYGDFLYRYAQSRLRDPNAAEEVVQETFLAGIRHSKQFAGTGSQRGWLMGILRRKIVDHVRARSRGMKRSLDDEYDPTALLFDENGRWKKDALPTVESSQPIESQELWQIVRSCLKNIPQGQADVFVLSVMEELDTDEICKVLNISASNMWVRLHRARLGLAKCVGAKWFGGESGVFGHE